MRSCVPRMLKTLLWGLALLAASLQPLRAAAAHEGDDSQRKLLEKYCLDCHNYDKNAGGLSLEGLDPARVNEDLGTGENMVRKVRAGMMPPAGEPRPSFQTLQGFAASLESTLDGKSVHQPRWPTLHRFNRTEYANAIRDLLDMKVDTTRLLPVDDSSRGFDNQAGTLALSPTLLQAYLAAAGELSRLAVGSASSSRQVPYRVPEDETQNYAVEGLPFGTRGGTLISHVFPADAEYRIKVFAVNLGNMGNFRPFGEVRGERLEILVDGRRVGLFDWDAEFGVGRPFGEERGELRSIDVSVPVTAGTHAVGVTFLASNYAPGLDLNEAFDRSTIETGGLPGFTFYPHVGTVRVDGPFNARHATDSPSRRRIFTCHPARAEEEAACARQIFARLSDLAYRGYADAQDEAELMKFYAGARTTLDFEGSIEATLQRLLSDPKFIYRVETPPQDLASGASYRVDGLTLASRLSFFLWSSIPDAQLLEAARAGRLADSRGIREQVDRMLADPRSQTLAENFAGQWLNVRGLEGHVPVVSQFPDFDNNLRQAFRRETELFVDSLIRDNRSVLELLTADYTFVNERLAEHYGIPGIKGSRFRRVRLDGDLLVRRGLLGKGSLLTVSSQPGRTSPPVRGNWIMSNLIGVPAPPPPPNVPAIEAKVGDVQGNQHVPTIREQYTQHRADPACSGCHKMMDPIGFSLEPFDAVGHWRSEDAGSPIDAADVLYDGTRVNGPLDLQRFLLKYQDQFIRNFTEQLMTYAIGRGMEDVDMPMVRSVVAEASHDGYRLQSLIVALVNSDAFVMNTR
jgi:hypothetical protein